MVKTPAPSRDERVDVFAGTPTRCEERFRNRTPRQFAWCGEGGLMAYVWKSMELLAFGAFSAWGAHRTLVWLHEPPVRDRAATIHTSPWRGGDAGVMLGR